LKQTPEFDPRASVVVRRRVLRWRLLTVSAILAALIIVSDVREDPEVEVTGSEQVVFDWSQDACEPADIPDIPARAFRDAQGRVQLIASHYVNRRMTGPDLDHLTHDCSVIMAWRRRGR
jgi:hypothetical protein